MASDAFILYIPHGSDERREAVALTLVFQFFISHMVQMKGSILPVSILGTKGFISHMVQMKVISRLLK